MPCQSRPEPRFVTAIAIVECRNANERADADDWAREIARVGEILPIAEGAITAFAVRLDPEYAPLLSLMETSMRAEFPFARVEYPFNETTLGIVATLAESTGSRVMPVESCEVCHKAEPFPADVFVIAEDGARRRSGSVYCRGCATEMAARTPRSVAVSDAAPVALAA